MKTTRTRMALLTSCAALLCVTLTPTQAHAEPEPAGVWIDYAKLDELGIDRTNVDLAVAALVR